MRNAKDNGMTVTSVAHYRVEFTKVIKRPLPGQAKIAGTQTLDRAWQDLKKYVPRSIVAKRKGGPGNDSLWTYAQSFQWRRNMRLQGRNMFEELPKLKLFLVGL